MRLRLLLSAFLLVFMGYAVWLQHVQPIDSLAYNPPAAPSMGGDYQANDFLEQAQKLGIAPAHGGEDVALDALGRLYTGTANGDILRLSAQAGLEFWVNTGGRPLGLDFDSVGNLIVGDALLGLLSVNPAGEIRTLVTEVAGEKLGFADDVVVARDGRIYFTDASQRWPYPKFKQDMFEARPHGRLLRYDPRTGETELLLDDLYFANGVALSQAEDFVLVNETYRYRIQRYWLSGPKAGQAEVFRRNLPGFPDGISSNGNGVFWLVLYSPRNALVDRLHPYPAIKNWLARLSEWLSPEAERHGWVLGLDEEGNILHNFQDMGGDHLYFLTSAEQFGPHLYLGSLSEPWIARFALAPHLNPAPQETNGALTEY